MPLAFVVVGLALVGTALAPLPGALKVTVTPLTGLPKLSATVAWNAVPKAVFTAVLCGVPPVALMVAAAPAVLVTLKLAGVATPAAGAVTLLETPRGVGLSGI